jgi:electron transport complex protein RnfG
MSEEKTLSLVLVPTIICVVAGLALAFVYDITKEPIARAKLKAANAAVAQVLPTGDEGVIRQDIVDANGTTNTFYVTRKNARLIGVASKGTSPNGYNGNVSVIVGISMDFNQIEAIKVLEQNETPGLGDKCQSDKFLGPFGGRQLDDTIWKIKRDGGDVDAISGATITSRAATEAIAIALKRFSDNQDALIKENEVGELAPLDEVLD